MASIRTRLRRIKDDPTELIDSAVVERACLEAGHRWRERELDPVRTLTLFALQIAHGNAAIASVVRRAGGGFTESAYCQARARIPVEAVQAAFESLTARVLGRLGGMVPPGEEGRWRGHRTILIDGTGVSVPDSPELRERFGVAAQYKRGCGLPLASVLAIFDSRFDLLLRMHVAPGWTGDLRHAHALHPALSPGDVLVGDRAFCAYTHLATLRAAGIDGVFRMSNAWKVPFPARTGERGRRSYNRHRRQEPILVERLGKDDQVVELVKPHNRPAYLSPEQFAAIPSRLTVRVLRYTVRQPGWRSREIRLMTTLLDPAKYPAAELAALYLSRWRIEINLRHLKQTMGMNQLKCRSIDGVHRELLMFALVYNAVCATRAAAAAKQCVRPARLSFVDALRWLQNAAPTAGLPLETPPDLRLWGIRHPRTHPRRLKRGATSFPLMILPRSKYIHALTSLHAN